MTFKLPLASKPAYNGLTQGKYLDNLTVYVVDDSKDAADSLVVLLRAMGHLAEACYSGAELLNLTQRVKPDCIMLDISMAEMNGLELVQRLRADFGDDIILVAVTGTPPDDEIVQSTFVAVDHYFEKPVSLEQIRKLLSR